MSIANGGDPNPAVGPRAVSRNGATILRKWGLAFRCPEISRMRAILLRLLSFAVKEIANFKAADVRVETVCPSFSGLEIRKSTSRCAGGIAQ